MDDFTLPHGSLFLGFDNSTQSLKATVLDSNLSIICTEFIHFDSNLPHYNTNGGIRRDPSITGRIVSPPLMWVEALDQILQRLSNKLDLKKVVAISGSAQQHGSVYWRRGSSKLLSHLDHQRPLVDQLGEAFSVQESPIWMDSSTTEQCRKIEEAIGGGLELYSLTGSRAHERYAGPQIRRLYESQPEVYEATERISLVSSFMASLLLGRHACIDETDGAGMNLMDVRKREWSKLALEVELQKVGISQGYSLASLGPGVSSATTSLSLKTGATAPCLEEKLGKLAPAYAVAGQIASYFVRRFNFAEDCLVIQWSGDNPNSLAGLALNASGDLAISLGTSDTVFGIVDEPPSCPEGHVFPHPTDTKGYMIMLVYKNGSLTREDIRNRFAHGSWEVFNNYLAQTPPLNDGKLGFYYKEHEILPPLPAGFHRYLLEDFKGDTLDGLIEHEVSQFDAPNEVRALIEGQLLSMRAHAERFGMPVPPRRLMATGGASANTSILDILASVFGCPVHTFERPDSASLGAALRAAHGWLCNEKGAFVPIGSLYCEKLEKTSLRCKLSMSASDPALARKYGLVMRKRIEIETRLVERLGRL